MPDHDPIDDEDGVTLIVRCVVCGTEFYWRVGLEEPSPYCPSCRKREAGEA